jgi:hypothetical protein
MEIQMTIIERIEKEVREFTPQELSAFREWFAEFDAAAWDRQIEADIAAGKLDKLASEALAEHAAGKSRKL